MKPFILRGFAMLKTVWIRVYAGDAFVDCFSGFSRFEFFIFEFNAMPADNSTRYFTQEAISTRYVRFLIHTCGIQSLTSDIRSFISFSNDGSFNIVFFMTSIEFITVVLSRFKYAPI